jgi:Zn-dependent M28 family amino/carboxypeptidase
VEDIQERLETVSFSFELPNRRVVLRVRTDVEEKRTVNVVARLPGREIPEKAIVLTAHYDHVGENDVGEIFNGADDNASGTATLLEIAEAFARCGTPPRRSVWFAAVSGEERGLVGSRRFVAEPPVPLDDIVANVNMDMVGRGPADEVNVYLGPLRTDLEAAFPEAAAAARIRPTYVVARQDANVTVPRTGREKVNLKIPRTRANYFGRSDQASFYRKGIPAAFLFGITHADYHRPTDTFEKLNLERMRRIGRFAFFAAWQIAEEGLADVPASGKEPSPDAQPGSGGAEPGR